MATVLLHAVAKMVVGLPKAMSAIAFKPPSGARWRVLSEKEKVSYDSSGKTRMSRTQVNG